MLPVCRWPRVFQWTPPTAGSLCLPRLVTGRLRVLCDLAVTAAAVTVACHDSSSSSCGAKVVVHVIHYLLQQQLLSTPACIASTMVDIRMSCCCRGAHRCVLCSCSSWLRGGAAASHGVRPCRGSSRAALPAGAWAHQLRGGSTCARAMAAESAVTCRALTLRLQMQLQYMWLSACQCYRGSTCT